MREPDEAQWGTQMFVIEGFDRTKADQIDGFKVEAALRRRSNEFKLPRQDGFIFTYPGRDIATVNLEFKVTGKELTGRQSQTWVRFPDAGWKVVAAHVSTVNEQPLW